MKIMIYKEHAGEHRAFVEWAPGAHRVPVQIVASTKGALLSGLQDLLDTDPLQPLKTRRD